MAHLLIVDARFYSDVSDELIKGAVKEIGNNGGTYEQIAVPGALEVPAAIRFALDTGKFDGFVALGCVIKGETDHYEHVCRESMHGLNLLSINHMAAIGNGILTVGDKKQAIARATQGNKGGLAALACMAMVALKNQFGVSGR